MNQIENTIDCRSQEPWSIEDYIIYSDNRKDIIGFRCPGYCGQLVIPEPVETIAYSAFRTSNISGVIFPSSLKTIGAYAFSQCPNLKEIVIPDSVEEVDYNAFSSCEKLSTVTIQGEHTYIDDTCFEKCKNIKSVFLANPKPELLFSIFGDSEIEEFSSIINGNSIDVPSFIHSQENALRFASIYYHSCGMNITKVLGTPGDYTSFKSPSDSWGHQIEDFFEQGQTTSLILQENWFRHSGIGLVLGWNGYRALDIDDVDLEYWNNNDNKEIHYTLNDVVEKFLAILNLPKDYQWVVKSGSNRGFHIIFKSGDNTDYGITTLAYRESYYYSRFFSRIEIRWKDHLILPPSISSSGNRYQFLNNDFPTCLPSNVSLECIDNLMLQDFVSREARFGVLLS